MTTSSKFLFLDDIREPPVGYHLVRSSKDAVEFVIRNGMPEFISFDHDLGGDDTAMNFVNWIIDSVLNKELMLPRNFSFTVHSANPVGKINIQSKLNNFIKFVNSKEH